jgi:multiple sugar transport system ATP-binding protein
MNMLKGEVTDKGVVMASGLLLPLPPVHKAKPGQRVVYGIRPEHLDPGGSLNATVAVTEPTGPEIHIYADLGGEEICAITDERLGLARGDAIGLEPRLDKVHLFDAQSGKALW